MFLPFFLSGHIRFLDHVPLNDTSSLASLSKVEFQVDYLLCRIARSREPRLPFIVKVFERKSKPQCMFSICCEKQPVIISLKIPTMSFVNGKNVDWMVLFSFIYAETNINLDVHIHSSCLPIVLSFQISSR